MNTKEQSFRSSKNAVTTLRQKSRTVVGSVHNSLKILTPPQLVTLTPMALNDGEYYYDNGHKLEEMKQEVRQGSESGENSFKNIRYRNSYSSPASIDENYNNNHTIGSTLNDQAGTTRLKEIQQRLQRIVLTHPQSIRSHSQSC